MTRNATKFVTLLVSLVLLGAVNAATVLAAPALSYTTANQTYTEVSGGTVLATGTSINGYYGGVAIPFTFSWDGSSYSTVYVSGNGFVSFESSNSGNVNSAGIAAWRNNLTGTATGELSTTTLGSTGTRIFVIQWKNVTRNAQNSSNDVYNFQVRLFENTGRAEVVYGSMVVTGYLGAQIGARSVNSGPVYLQADYRVAPWDMPHANVSSAIESVASEGWAPASGFTYRFGQAGNVDASVISLANPTGKFAANTTMTITARIHNYGLVRLDSVEINWSINGIVRTKVKYYPQPGIAPGSEGTANLGTASFADGSFNTLLVWTSAANGGGDSNPGNDTYLAYLAPRVQGRLNIAQGGTNGIFNTFRDLFRHLYSSGISGNTDVHIFNGSYAEQIVVPVIDASPSTSIVTLMNAAGNAPVITWRPQQYPNTMYGSYESDFAQATLSDGASANFKGLKFQLDNGLNYGGHINSPNSLRIGVDACNFQGPSNFLTASQPTYSIGVFNGTYSITNNTVNNMRYAIDCESWGYNGTISGNTITNTAEQGIWGYSSNLTMNKNSVTAAAGASNFTGIGAEGAGTCSNNIISGDVSVASGSQSVGMYVYSYNGIGGNNGLLTYNNMVSVAATSGAFGMYVYADASLTRTRVYHNSVNVTGTAAGNSVALWNLGYSACDVINNIFQNVGSGSNGGYAVYAQDYSATSVYNLADFNDLYTSGTTIGVFGGFAYAKNTTGNPLTNWRNGTGRDLNSSSVLVNFVGGADLHLLAIQNGLWGSSAITSTVPTDIDGETRTKPYMGADEVKPSIRILQHPQSRYACLGESFTIICVAEVTEGAVVTYQWYKDGVELTGQTGAILSFGSIGYGSSGVYTCLVKANDGTNFVQEWSNPASIIVVRSTSITLQPVSQPVVIGGTVNLEVAAEAIGAPTDFVPTYQWKKRYWSTTSNAYLDSNVVDNGRITGAQSSRLTIRDIQSVDTMDAYIVEVAGYCGTAVSKTAKLFIPIVAASNNTPNACVGGMIQIECAVFPSAIPGSTVMFQWYKDNSPLFDGGNVSGATTKVLTIQNVTAADAGTYRCFALYDGANVSIASNDVVVTVSVPPTIAAEPVGDTVCEGSPIVLSVGGAGDNLSYRWFKGTTEIPNQTDDTLMIAAATTADAGVYQAKVYNSCGEVMSANADVAVNTAPNITTSPSDVALIESQPLSLTVVAEGSEPLTYQWFKNDTAIASADAATYTVTGVMGVDDGTYTCVVTNECGSDTSDAAVVSVTVGVTGEVAYNGFKLGVAAPNPTSDVVSFTYTIPSAQTVMITLTNIVGNNVATLANERIDAGTYTVNLSAQDLNLAPGVYTYTVFANGFVGAQQFVVVR